MIYVQYDDDAEFKWIINYCLRERVSLEQLLQENLYQGEFNSTLNILYRVRAKRLIRIKRKAMKEKKISNLTRNNYRSWLKWALRQIE